MKTVYEILNKKGSDYWYISPDSTVYEALELMSKKDIGALLIIENGNVMGIISERDYARKVALLGRLSREIPVNEIMSTKVIYVKPQNTPQECMALMTEKHVRHLPVIEDDKLIGLISIGDVVKAVIEDHQFVIDQLVQYITGMPKIKTTAKAHDNKESSQVVDS